MPVKRRVEIYDRARVDMVGNQDDKQKDRKVMQL